MIKAILKLLRYVGITILLIISGGIFYGCSIEPYVYLSRNEATVQKDATALFMELCERYGFEPNSFTGPKKVGPRMYEWTRAPLETISIGILYFPYDLPYSLSEQLVQTKSNL